jgi:hypothetical protein
LYQLQILLQARLKDQIYERRRQHDTSVQRLEIVSRVDPARFASCSQSASASVFAAHSAATKHCVE